MAQKHEVEAHIKPFLDALNQKDEVAVQIAFANLATFAAVDLFVNIGRIADALERIAANTQPGAR